MVRIYAKFLFVTKFLFVDKIALLNCMRYIFGSVYRYFGALYVLNCLFYRFTIACRTCHFPQNKSPFCSFNMTPPGSLNYVRLFPCFYIIRIYHECEGMIEKIVPRIAVWHHEACQLMTNGDLKGRIFLSYPHTNNGFFFLLTTVFIN